MSTTFFLKFIVYRKEQISELFGGGCLLRRRDKATKYNQYYIHLDYLLTSLWLGGGSKRLIGG